MKKLMIILLLVLSASAQAQNLVGTKRSDIKFVADSEGWHYQEAKGVNGVPFIEVAQDSNNIKFYFFNQFDVCTTYLVFYGDRSLEEISESLSAAYARRNDLWFAENCVIAVERDDSLNGYFVKFKKL